MDLAGISVAGMETCIEVPSLKLLLDLGRCSPSAVNQRLVLLSHGHLDHIGAITQHAARRSLLGMAEGIYVVPKAIAPRVEALFAAAGALDGQTIPRQVVELEPGESFEIGKNRWVQPFETFHRVPSQGYTVWERRTRLRPEFRGLPGARLGELRRAGTDLDESHSVALLSFTGDTRIEALEQCADLQRTETLVIETSFLDDRVSVPDARDMGHIHLEELVERAALLPRGEVVLSHFSGRYQSSEIEGIVRKRLPDDLQGIVRVLL